MFGLALGGIGLSRLEFEAMTPDEFNAVYRAWNELETARSRAAWEQSRFIAHCAVMPHTRRPITPTDLVRFDWDQAPLPAAAPASRADFERMRKRFGE